MSGVRFATRSKFLLASMAAGTVLLVCAPVAAAQPPGPDPLIAPIGMASAQPATTTPRIKLDIDQLTPRVVRADSGGVTVAGRVTNTGDRRIEDIEIRLQRGEVLNTEAKLRDAMTQPPTTEAAKSDFVPMNTKSLEPGVGVPFTITVSLDVLRLEQPGVYPVLINVNGRPAYGNAERLASLNVLLPVVSTPSRGVTPPAAPSRITLLWPLADDHPRVLQQTANRQVVLSDDDLATSLSVGGRLYGMVNTIKTAISANNSLPSSVCFAVDGDLLTTVKSMSEGYQVRTPDGRTTPGKGQAFAQRWLSDVKSLTNGRCVIALPYADADLSALSRADAADLAQSAADQGFSTVASILAPVQPQQGVIWPADGTLDQRALADVTGASPKTVLSNSERLSGISGTAPYTIGQNRVVPIDQLASSTLNGAVPGPVSVQNGLAVLVFRAVQQNEPGQSVLIAPPRRWTASTGEQAMYLQTINQLYTDRLVNPQVLPDLITAPAKGTATGLDYSQQEAAAELPGQLMTDVTKSNAMRRDLAGAMHTDDTNRIDPEELIAPIRRGLLRATSSAWRTDVGGALRMAADVRSQLDSMRAQVTVSPPGPPISLASSSSPIPIRIGNSLPVAVNVRFAISESSGLRPATIPERRISGRSSTTVIIPAELLRAGKFTLDVQVTTPGGTSLGTSSRYEISSTSYGTITMAVTGVAGGVLVLLAGRRIYRRGKKSKSEQQEQSPA